MPLFEVRLQILIAFTIESGKPSSYLIRSDFIFLLEQSLIYKEPILDNYFKVCPLGRGTRYYVPSTLCLLFLSPPSRNTLHTDRAHQPVQNPPNNVSCIGSKQAECTKIKTQKLLLVGNVEGSVEDSS